MLINYFTCIEGFLLLLLMFLSLSFSPGQANNIAGYLDGIGTYALFNSNNGLAIDNRGNVYVPEQGNNVIRVISPTGVVTTLAGNVKVPVGYLDGIGTNAVFNNPYAVAVSNAAGILYVLEFGNSDIRQVFLWSGTVTLFAGNSKVAYFDHSDGVGSNACFDNPGDMKIDSSGYLWVADGNFIRKVSPEGLVTTFYTSSDIGISSVSLDTQGNVYCFDGYKILKISTDGVVLSTLAGGGSSGKQQGNQDGSGTAASFNCGSYYTSTLIDSSGNIFLADMLNNEIRKITPTGVVTTIAGNVNSRVSFADGVGTNSVMYYPSGLTLDTVGNLYISDSGNNNIRKISPTGT